MGPYMDSWEHLSEYLSLLAELAEERKVLSAEPDETCRERFCTRINAVFDREAKTKTALPLSVLRGVFSLDFAAFFLVAAALSFELDGGLRALWKSFRGRSFPTVEDGFLLLELFEPLDLSILSSAFAFSPLTGLLLRGEEGEGALLERPLLLNRSVTRFLTCGLGAENIFFQLYLPGTEVLLPLHGTLLNKLSSLLTQEDGLLLLLRGRSGSGRHSLIKGAANRLGRPAIFTELEFPDGTRQEDGLRELAAAAVLTGAILCVALSEKNKLWKNLKKRILAYSVPLILVCGERQEIVWPTTGQGLELSLPDFLENGDDHIAWEGFASRFPPGGYQPFELSSRYRMTVGEVRRVTEEAARLSRLENRPADAGDVAVAVQSQSRPPECGALLKKGPSLKDLVLPDDVQRQLIQLQGMVLHQRALEEEWGFRGGIAGVTALFHGESGTGKTMAASALAQELGMPLLRADLSGVIDKYIGETEKHLEKLFSYATENNCVLFFDEADALFGKRTTVESSHDKYANASSSYLLQRLEHHEGVALLATNLLHNFDEAFLRRIQVLIKFPMPEPLLRETLWQRAFPAEKLAEEVDFSLLARVELAPARIREAARSAAVLALCEGENQVGLLQLVEALRLELKKDGRLLPQYLQEVAGLK